MRNIVKGREPTSLVQHRNQPNSSYDNYGDKDALRKSLVSEQRGLCCYCMSEIGPTRGKMKIEHWKSKANHLNLELDYKNLLGACMGGEGQIRKNQHCDTFKGSRDLSINPADSNRDIEKTYIIQVMDSSLRVIVRLMVS